nr:hypothetical protein [uncultured Pseudodesulfovibrio sp.]
MLKWLKENIAEGTKIIGDTIAEERAKKQKKADEHAAKQGFTVVGTCNSCGKTNTRVKKNDFISGKENENICYKCYKKLMILSQNRRG